MFVALRKEKNNRNQTQIDENNIKLQKRIYEARSQLSRKDLLKETEDLRSLYNNVKKGKNKKPEPETSKFRNMYVFHSNALAACPKF